ncbi:hypothetical protein VTJ49DRAFT_1423 [Mycothermus thermophilus]|uniref:Ribosome recycling factor domain-containing protein n=1 Tax=Humicola insolens TaxID=85995 RepID=A0ABR3VEG4_HUMIN
MTSILLTQSRMFPEEDFAKQPLPAMTTLRAASKVLRSHAVASASASRFLVQDPPRRDPERKTGCGVLVGGNLDSAMAASASRRGNDDNGKASKKDKNNKDSGKSESSGAAADQLDPFDLTDLTTAFDRAEEHFTSELKKLRSAGGGKFTAEAIGAIPVQPDRKNPQTFPLRELATIAPLGGGSGGGAGARRWSILAFDESSIKPILSAVQRAEGFNQQPQRNPDNPLELVMTAEPERVEETAKRAKEACQAWRDRVRGDAHKRTELVKKLKSKGKMLGDDVRRLTEKVQKLQDERMKVIQQREKEVVNAIMARAG